MSEKTLPERLRDLLDSKKLYYAAASGEPVLAIYGTAKRLQDLELAARDSEAFQEWLDKTEWVQSAAQADELPGRYIGMHRADIMKAEIDRMRGELESATESRKLAQQSLYDARERFQKELLQRTGEVSRLLKERQDREPLSDEQINQARRALPFDEEDRPDPWDFAQGFRAAEKAYGIGGQS